MEGLSNVNEMELSQRRLLEALRASPATLLEQDLDLRFVAVVNAQPPLDEATMLGKTTFDLLPPDEAEVLTRIKKQVITSGQGTRTSLQFTYDNRTREYSLVVEPRRDSEGNITGVVCVAWDVTRERAIERALENSRAQLCSFVSEAPTGVALLDRDLRYMAVSRSWIREMGRGETEFIGRHHYELWPDALPEWIDNHKKALEGHSTHREEDLWVRPDGSKLWTRWAVYPWRDFSGEIGGIVLAIDDISERKRAEIALKESEERFRMMAETVPDSLFITRADGYSEYVNEEYCKITGLKPGTTDGNGWADAVHPDDRERIMRAWMTAVETEEPYEERLRIVNLQTGLARWYLARAMPMRDEHGKIARWFGCTTDIENQVREAALRETDRKKNEFLAMLSHELRNPLAAIRSAIYLIQHVPPADPSALNAQAVIDRQVTHLTRIVDDLLDIARIARGKFQVERRRLDIGEALRRAVEDQRPEFDKRGLELDCWLGSKELWVDGDETRLVQVIDNLLGNALKFTPRGGRVEVFLKNENDSATLRVRDSGIGIPPERLTDLFEPFVQLNPVPGHLHGGLGLGLALIKGIVEMHGGSVSVRSAGAGQGTEFVVRLPIAPKGQPAAAVRQNGSMKRRCVLLIEDNIDMAELLRQLLVVLGQNVHVANDGMTGIELARRIRPDLVICDIGLPELSGLEVARRLRTDELFRTTEIVALSGYGLPEDRRKSADAGFSRHIVKPVSMDDIERLLSEDIPSLS